MSRPLFKRPHVQDISWAYDMVARGVKAISIINGDLNCDDSDVDGILDWIMEQVQGSGICYLDIVRKPALSGIEYTGGILSQPVIRAVPNKTEMTTHTVIFAATDTMADLFEWAFCNIKEKRGQNEEVRRAHAIVGLLCGYSPLAIESFLEQPSGFAG